MRWLNSKGQLKFHSDNKYRIKWSSPAPSSLAQNAKDFFFRYSPTEIWFAEYRLPNCLLRVDFLNATRKLAFEISDNQHISFNPFFQKNRSGFLKQIKNDVNKREILEKNGYTLIEIFKKDLPLTKEWFVKNHNIIF